MIYIEEIAQKIRENQNFHGSVRRNESLKSHTTMNVGGMAKVFLEPNDAESFVLTAIFFRENEIPFFVLGGGSNVIVNDDGLDAVISTRKMNKIEFPEIQTSVQESTVGEFIKIECGAAWGSVISFCKKNNLGGFEGFSGLSGTCGGAIFMNATCFGLSACDNLVSVDYFDLTDKKIHTYKKNPSDWDYKKSPFQECEMGALRGASPFIILSAVFRVRQGFDFDFSEKCVNSRKEKGHFRSPSAGSAFKNDAAKGIIAGKVIDECGLKGFSVGGAQIAPWHGNFIINPEKKATAADVKNLSDTVKKIVLEKTGVTLESEIIFV